MPATSLFLEKPTRSLAQAQAERAPFLAGDRVLDRSRPWDGCRIVTGCERHEKWGWRIFIRSGAATGHDLATRYLLAPADWIEPPPRPLFRNDIINETTTYCRLASDAERVAYYRAYIEWGRTHLIPLGHESHVAGFERLVAEAAPVAQAAQ